MGEKDVSGAVKGAWRLFGGNAYFLLQRNENVSCRDGPPPFGMLSRAKKKPKTTVAASCRRRGGSAYLFGGSLGVQQATRVLRSRSAARAEEDGGWPMMSFGWSPGSLQIGQSNTASKRSVRDPQRS